MPKIVGAERSKEKQNEKSIKGRVSLLAEPSPHDNTSDSCGSQQELRGAGSWGSHRGLPRHLLLCVTPVVPFITPCYYRTLCLLCVLLSFPPPHHYAGTTSHGAASYSNVKKCFLNKYNFANILVSFLPCELSHLMLFTKQVSRMPKLAPMGLFSPLPSRNFQLKRPSLVLGNFTPYVIWALYPARRTSSQK